MAKILYQHLSRENAGTPLLHPIVQEIRKTMDDPVLFERKVRKFISETDLLPIPEKLPQIGRLVDTVRETAESWGLIATVTSHPHCIRIESWMRAAT